MSHRADAACHTDRVFNATYEETIVARGPAAVRVSDGLATGCVGSVLAGSGGRSAAAEDFGAVGAAGSGGAVRGQGDGPAPLVNHNTMVKGAKKRTIPHRSGAAVGQVGQLVDLAGRRGLVAAAHLFTSPRTRGQTATACAGFTKGTTWLCLSCIHHCGVTWASF
jgi:hypothetical protein